MAIGDESVLSLANVRDGKFRGGHHVGHPKMPRYPTTNVI